MFFIGTKLDLINHPEWGGGGGREGGRWEENEVNNHVYHTVTRYILHIHSGNRMLSLTRALSTDPAQWHGSNFTSVGHLNTQTPKQLKRWSCLSLENTMLRMRHSMSKRWSNKNENWGCQGGNFCWVPISKHWEQAFLGKLKNVVAVGTVMVVYRVLVWASKPANIYHGFHILHIV